MGGRRRGEEDALVLPGRFRGEGIPVRVHVRQKGRGPPHQPQLRRRVRLGRLHGRPGRLHYVRRREDGALLALAHRCPRSSLLVSHRVRQGRKRPRFGSLLQHQQRLCREERGRVGHCELWRGGRRQCGKGQLHGHFGGLDHDPEAVPAHPGLLQRRVEEARAPRRELNHSPFTFFFPKNKMRSKKKNYLSKKKKKKKKKKTPPKKKKKKKKKKKS